MQLAVLALECDQAGTKGIDTMRPTVAVVVGQAQAVPATGVTLGELFHFDSVQCGHLVFSVGAHG